MNFENQMIESETIKIHTIMFDVVVDFRYAVCRCRLASCSGLDTGFVEKIVLDGNNSCAFFQ